MSATSLDTPSMFLNHELFVIILWLCSGAYKLWGIKKNGYKDLKATGEERLIKIGLKKGENKGTIKDNKYGSEISLERVSKKKSRMCNTVQSSNIFENQFDF